MNVIEIFAKFVMDTSSLDDGLKDAEKKTSSFGSKIGLGLAGAAKLGAAALATTATAAIGAATAVAAVAKQSADAYAEYQQLQGGVETLFNDGGKAAANYRAELEAAGATEAEIARAMANFKDPTAQVLENAANAYKTAGMSANQYMNTVINMAASLNKSTGDMEESTRLADMAITDMSDNVNKMGTTMEMVENAYRGFTRGNFTMLDNLALGYAGTKEGMQELLADAEKISGIKYDISSYADIVQAIHTIQEEMDITNTTQEEAAKTISGSAGALSAAWDNLILGLADKNADLGELVDNVVQSAKTAFTNIIPAFTQAVRGIGDLVGQIAPVIAEELPGLVDQVLPPLLDAASSLISSVVTEAIPGLLGVLEQNSDMLMSSIMGIIDTVLNGLYEFVVKDLDSLLTTLVDNIITPLLAETPHLLATLINIAGQVISSLATQLPALITVLVQTIVDLLGVALAEDNITYYTGIALDIIKALAEGLLNGIPILLKALPDLIEGLTSGLLGSAEMIVTTLMTEITPMLEKALPEIYGTLATLIPELSEKVLPLLENFATNVIPPLVEQWAGLFQTELPKFIALMMPILNAFIMGLVQADTLLAKTLPPIIEALAPLLTVVFQAIADTLPVVLPIIADGLKILIVALSDTLVNEYGPVFGEMVSRIFTAIWNEIVELWDTFVQPIIDKIVEWWDGVKNTGESKLAEIWETITTKLDEIWQGVLNFLEPILSILVPYWEAVGNLFRSLFNLAVVIFKLIRQTIHNVLEKIWSKIQEVWQAIIDFISPILYDIKAKVEEIWNGIVDFLTPVIDGLKTTIDEAFQFIYDNAVQPLLDLQSEIERIFGEIKDFILEFVDGALDWGGDMINNFSQGITDGLGDLSGAIDTVTGKLSANLEHSVPDEGPLSDDDKWMPDMMQSFAKGIRDNTALVDNAIVDAFDFRGMLGGNGTPGNGGLIAPTATQPITIVLELDKQQFGKIVYNMNQAETQRVGVTLGKEAFA